VPLTGLCGYERSRPSVCVSVCLLFIHSFIHLIQETMARMTDKILFVRLFVRSQRNSKTNDPKVFKQWHWDILQDMFFSVERSKLVLGLGLWLGLTAIRRGSNSI